ncbi:hypothetical protein NLU13_8058 [Sarocladium strictum]|uniref:Myb-like DNA-binding domain protein n=1 Tax=Sarocladium strictum TaxID=5046 RepID=A0AA39GBK7_SARSR|nr:hypothetical protein NLU13_8058 [Sarocladium strictum]
MESPAKRRRIDRSWESEEDDEHLSQPQDEPDGHDRDYELQVQRAFADNRFQSTMAHIFEKYGRDFDGVGDEIDMMTGEIVVNNGHLSNMRNETDVGTGLPQDEDDAEDGGEEGGLRLEDLLDEDQFESSEEDGLEDEDEDENGGEGEQDQDGTHAGVRADQADRLRGTDSRWTFQTMFPRPAHASLQELPSEGFIPGPFTDPTMGFGASPFGFGFGASPLSFGHAPWPNNPWGQHHLPQQAIWDGPEIPQQQATANRLALQTRQQRQSPSSEVPSTSIWTSGTRYERAHRTVQRGLQPRSRVLMKSRPKKQPLMLGPSSHPSGNMKDRRPYTKRQGRTHQSEVQDSDDEESLPTPRLRGPLQHSKNQGNDKNPDHSPRSQNKNRQRRGKRKLSSPEEFSTADSPNDDENAAPIGRYGRQRKPVEHFSQLTWPVSRQGKWRSERKAAAREAGEQASTEESTTSSSEAARSPPSSVRRRQVGFEHMSTGNRRLKDSDSNTTMKGLRVVPDSQDSQPIPASSQSQSQKPTYSTSTAGNKNSGSNDLGDALSDDEMPMRVLPTRFAPTTARSLIHSSIEKDGGRDDQTHTEDGGHDQFKPTSEHSWANAEIPPPPASGEWVLIKTTKRPPYYRRLKRKDASEPTKKSRRRRKPFTKRKAASKRKSAPDTEPSPNGESVSDDASVPNRGAIQTAEFNPRTAMPGNVSETAPGDDDEWVLVNTTKRSAYYRRKHRRKKWKLLDRTTAEQRRLKRLNQRNESELNDPERIVDHLRPGRRSEVLWLLEHNGEQTPEPEMAMTPQPREGPEVSGSYEKESHQEEVINEMVQDVNTATSDEAAFDIHARTTSLGPRSTDLPEGTSSQDVTLLSADENIDTAPINEPLLMVHEGTKAPSSDSNQVQPQEAATAMQGTVPALETVLPSVEEREASPANGGKPEVSAAVNIDASGLANDQAGRPVETVLVDVRDDHPTTTDVVSAMFEALPEGGNSRSVSELVEVSVEASNSGVANFPALGQDTRRASDISMSGVEVMTSTIDGHTDPAAIQTTAATSSPVVYETDQDGGQSSSAPLRLASPELGSPAFAASPVEDPYDLPPSPAARPRTSPSKVLATSPAKPSPLRKSEVNGNSNGAAVTERKALSPRKPVSPSKINKPPHPRTPKSHRNSPRKSRTPSSRRSLLSLSRNNDADDDDLDELSLLETPPITKVSVPKRRSSVSRRIWKATPRTTEVSRELPVRKEAGRGRTGEAQGDVMRTPGGTLRTCGVDGFTCGRDFCFVCM